LNKHITDAVCLESISRRVER